MIRCATLTDNKKMAAIAVDAARTTVTHDIVPLTWSKSACPGARLTPIWARSVILGRRRPYFERRRPLTRAVNSDMLKGLRT